MAAPASQISAMPRPLVPRRDLVEAVWEAFASLKPTIPIMIIAALACVLGTFANPENSSLNDVAVALAKQPSTFMGTLWKTGIYSFFELNDLFHSWWFELVLVLLALNLTACTIDRLPRIYTIALHPERRLDDKVLLGLRHSVRLPFQGDAATEVARLAAAFKVRGFPTSIDRADDGTYYLFAERGRFARFGVYIVHAALLLILAGGLAGRFIGYEGNINVFQSGGTFDFVFLKTGDGALYRHTLPATVRVDDFRHTQYADGSDKGFESDLSVLDVGGNVLHQQTISVGHPMAWAGWTYYQASYQAAPDRSAVRVTVVDKTTGGRKEFKVRPEDQFSMGPGALFQIADYRADFAGLGPAVRVVRRGVGSDTDFWVFKDKPHFDADNRDDRYGLEFGGIQPMYFTGLQVARDPGAFWVFLGCFILFGGLFTAFYTSHRRLWARVTPSEVLVAGSAHKNHFAFETVFTSLETAVRGAPAMKTGAAS